MCLTLVGCFKGTWQWDWFLIFSCINRFSIGVSLVGFPILRKIIISRKMKQDRTDHCFVCLFCEEKNLQNIVPSESFRRTLKIPEFLLWIVPRLNIFVRVLLQYLCNFVPFRTFSTLSKLFGADRTEQGYLTNPQLTQHSEPVAVLASLHSSHPNASMKQYECGRTQPLLCTRQRSRGKLQSKPKGLRQNINNNHDIHNT